MTQTEIREVDVPEWPGWVRLVQGGNRQYRSPGGVVISNRRFMELGIKYRGQKYIPESDLIKPSTKTSGFFSSTSTKDRKDTSKAAYDTKAIPNTDTGTDTGIGEVLNVPEPKPHAGKSGGGRASPKELSDGLYISISIATSIVALLLREPQLAATDLEAKNIAIPAANLLAKSKLNERFGRLIAESGDWQLLGYAIWMYFSRVTDVVKMKRTQSGPQSNAPRTSQSNVPNTPASPNGAASAPGGFISNGAKSPPGVTPTTFIRQ